MEDVNALEDLDAHTVTKIAIQKFQKLASSLTDDQLMDLAHNCLNDLREAKGFLNNDTAPKAVTMAAALAEVNARRETIFKPIGEAPIEDTYEGIFSRLNIIPDHVADAIASGGPFSAEMLDAILELIIHICMFSPVRSERFKNSLKDMGKENQRKKKKEEKVNLRQKQRENQMTPARFWTLLVLGILGFLIIVGRL